jgi:hypothetical protein
MLVVKLEIWPHGNEGRAREIGRMQVANVGGDVTIGDYSAAIMRDRGAPGFGEVKQWPRLERDVWQLIASAILSTFPEEL